MLSKPQLQHDKERDCLILVLEHLQSAGYHEVVSLLKVQAPVLGRWTCADNINLHHVLTEFYAYKDAKLGRKPLISRRCNTDGAEGVKEATKCASISRKKQAAAARRRASMQYAPEGGSCAAPHQSGALRPIQSCLSQVDQASAPKESTNNNKNKNNSTDSLDASYQGIAGTAIERDHGADNEGTDVVAPEDRLVKPTPSFGDDTELKFLAQSIQREIIQTNTGVSWDDIIDLQEPKRLLREAVVMPIQYPTLFTGLLSPWGGVLLYGPPGTGKTMLAKAVAAQTNTTFFNISASSIVSKFRGDSEKLVRVLFEMARHHAPSTVFLDEIDSIMGSRSSGIESGCGGGGGEHEGSRRMKTELLVQMDGLACSDSGGHHVFVLAASNLPWQLDPALLRRLDKRVLVPPPDTAGRIQMLRTHLASLPARHTCEEADLRSCAEATDGYSGADLRLLAKEAAMRAVRRIMDSIKARGKRQQPLPPAEIEALKGLHPVTATDLQESLACTNRSYASQYYRRYDEWAQQYGSV